MGEICVPGLRPPRFPPEQHPCPAGLDCNVWGAPGLSGFIKRLDR